MNTVPTDPPPPDPWRDHPTIDAAEAALRQFGGQHLGRAHAATLLELWQHRPALTDREVAAILDRFQDRP